MAEIINLGVKNRECGTCTACCYALGVGTLQKPPEHTCEYVLINPKRLVNPLRGVDVGCKAHMVRPEACRSFNCLWLQGVIPEGHPSPEQVGLVFSMAADEVLGKHIICWPGRPGAYGEELAKRYLAEMATDFLIVINGAGETALIGPPAKLRKAAKDLSDKLGAVLQHVKK